MARSTKTVARGDDGKPKQTEDGLTGHRYCAMPHLPAPKIPEGATTARAEAILLNQNKWVNQTTLRYFFFDKATDGDNVVLSNGLSRFVSWVGSKKDMNVVRQAFKDWHAIGMGLSFVEVTDRTEAEIRIGFMPGDGSWSYVGTQILEFGPEARTMNFGWSLQGTDGADTARHEIGHTLGLPHEHQNPFSGIVWNEDAVYKSLAAPPNRWEKSKTFHNIIRKIDKSEVRGSKWDPDSIMHYPFEAGLILEPAQYASGLKPAGGLSPLDIAWVQSFYPPVGNQKLINLKPSVSQALAAKNGEQANYLIEPPATRYYDMRTFGTCDTTMVLFEERDGEWRYLSGDEDSSDDRNASLRIKLVKGRRYALRIRLKYSDSSSEPAVMMW